MNKITRRKFVQNLALVGGTIVMGAKTLEAAKRKSPSKLHLACNQYPWLVFYQRENRDFNADLDKGLGELASSGMDGYEPLVNNPQEIDRLGPLLKKNGLEMRSLYVNSVLHERQKADQSIDSVLAISEKAKSIGTKIIVTNPSPIQWGGSQNKDDSQLRVQAASLEKLGRQLKAMGLTLSYHNHDIELRNAAREFHHMMVGTDPAYVTLCLDAHWVYRGAGNSAVALFDVLKLYGRRITELHLRQSKENIWSETFEDGDINYRRLAKHLLGIDISPHIVLEQAVEKGTPKTMETVEAFRQSSKYARRIFAEFG
ncbi:MAG: TIM barrel protein [Planctomycetes bacterium]|nr:TIM barrel protein [Planctomycetota bacterium]MBL7143737.1 TIM barrel protein [Phycisphaerae bacterium]